MNLGSALRTIHRADLTISSGNDEMVEEQRMSLRGDEKGIRDLGDGTVAWFRDPGGNTFAIEEGTDS
jgi:hypothetical protein